MNKSLLFLFFIFYCCQQSNSLNDSEQNHAIQVKLLAISFGLVHYENTNFSESGKKLESSRIAMSDSIFLIYTDHFFISEETKPESSIWLKGNYINTDKKFDSLKNNYSLRELPMSEFLNQEKDTLSKKETCFSKDKEFHFRNLINEITIKFPRTNDSNDSILVLSLCHKHSKTKDIFINFGNPPPKYPSVLLYDITGDGIEEIFIGEEFVTSSGVFGYNVKGVYQILLKTK